MSVHRTANRKQIVNRNKVLRSENENRIVSGLQTSRAHHSLRVNETEERGAAINGNQTDERVYPSYVDVFELARDYLGLSTTCVRRLAGQLENRHLADTIRPEPARRPNKEAHRHKGPPHEHHHFVPPIIRSEEACGTRWIRCARQELVLEAQRRIGERIRHYRLTEPLDCGGRGIVYRAEDVRRRREVALKLLPDSADTDARTRKRFMSEIQCVAAIDHPNVCNIVEVGETDEGMLYVVMPFYDCATLANRLEGGLLSAEDAMRIGLQIANGVTAAHRRGIVHGQLEPANILMTEGWLVKIIDYGIARLDEYGRGGSGAEPRGTVRRSPEQLQGRGADIWGLGLTLFEALVGCCPYHVDGVSEDSSVRRELAEGLRVHRPEVPEDLRDVIMKCLATDPEDRYRAASEIVRDLRIALSFEARRHVGAMRDDDSTTHLDRRAPGRAGSSRLSAREW